MRPTHLAFAGVAAVLAAAPALAAPAQCFWNQGAPVGPVYRTEAPEPGWIRWVQSRGGFCRPINEFERQSLERRPQVYPPEYTSAPDYRPPGYVPPGYTPPPEQGWFGDSRQVAYLVSQWLANQGRPYAQVIDTGRVEFLYERQWRIFFARWADGQRTRIAVRYSRRGGGEYVAMQFYGGAWSQPQPIGP